VGVRGKCCWQWETVVRIPMSEGDWEDLITEAGCLLEEQEEK